MEAYRYVIIADWSIVFSNAGVSFLHSNITPDFSDCRYFALNNPIILAFLLLYLLSSSFGQRQFFSCFRTMCISWVGTSGMFSELTFCIVFTSVFTFEFDWYSTVYKSPEPFEYLLCLCSVSYFYRLFYAFFVFNLRLAFITLSWFCCFQLYHLFFLYCNFSGFSCFAF